MTLGCKACGHHWEQDLLPNGPEEVHLAVARWEKMTCPHCGAGWTSLTIGAGKAIEKGRERREATATGKICVGTAGDSQC